LNLTNSKNQSKKIIRNRIIKKLLIPKKLYASEAEKVQIPNPIISEIARNKGTSSFVSFFLFKKVIAVIGIPAIKKIEIISVDKKMIFTIDLPLSPFAFQLAIKFIAPN
jgi:hypothetical protein